MITHKGYDMSFEDQIAEIQRFFPLVEIALLKEGGCRFLRLSSFFPDPENSDSRLDCLFACDPHLGYDSRIWFPKALATSVPRNWNHKNTYILGQKWCAFSFKAKGKSLLEKLLSHIGGAK